MLSKYSDGGAAVPFDRVERRLKKNGIRYEKRKMICIRCHEPFGEGSKCMSCGVAKDRAVRKIRRHRKATGKRGRNSGTVGTAKKKS